MKIKVYDSYTCLIRFDSNAMSLILLLNITLNIF